MVFDLTTNFTRSQRLVCGIFLLVLAVTVWAISTEVTQYYFQDADYDKPYFLVYVKNSMLILYLNCFLLSKRWRSPGDVSDTTCPSDTQEQEQLTYQPENTSSAEDIIDEPLLSEPKYVPLAYSSDSERSSNHNLGTYATRTTADDLSSSDSSSLTRSVRFNRFLEVRHMTDSQAEAANLARLSYPATLRQQEAARRLRLRVCIGKLLRLAAFVALAWFGAIYAHREAASITARKQVVSGSYAADLTRETGGGGRGAGGVFSSTAEVVVDVTGTGRAGGTWEHMPAHSEVVEARRHVAESLRQGRSAPVGSPATEHDSSASSLYLSSAAASTMAARPGSGWWALRWPLADVLQAMASVFVLVIAAVLSSAARDRINLTKFVSVSACVSGVAVVSTSNPHPHHPHEPGQVIFLTTVSSFLFAITAVVISKKSSDESHKVEPAGFLGFIGLMTMVCLWPGIPVLDKANIEKFVLPNRVQLLCIVLDGLMRHVICHYLWFWGCLLTSSVIAVMSLSLMIPISVLVSGVLHPMDFAWTWSVVWGSLPIFVAFAAVSLCTYWDNADPVCSVSRRLVMYVCGNLCWCCRSRSVPASTHVVRRYSSKSPPSAISDTMQMTEWISMMAWHTVMFGWSSFLHTAISLARNFIVNSSGTCAFCFITYTARSLPATDSVLLFHDFITYKVSLKQATGLGIRPQVYIGPTKS